MITRITGVLNRVLDEEARLQVGALEYAVLVPEYVRRKIQGQLGKELSLHTVHYLDGNPMQGRVVPRLIGFLNEAELEFFDLFCTVDKVGTRKALKALVRPVREIASAIQREDSRWLTSLPGIGAAGAEQIVASLKRKVTRFTAIASTEGAAEPGAGPEGGIDVDGQVIEDAYLALLQLGHGPLDARTLLDRVLSSGQDLKSVDEILMAIYKQPG